MDEDEDDFAQPDAVSPAHDALAHVLRWIGLLCGLAMLSWTAILLT